MKRCKDCKAEKPESEYYTYKHGEQVVLYARCKPCHREWKNNRTDVEDRRRHRRNHRAKVLSKLHELKTRPCADCGVQYPPYVMDFDHLDSEEKFNNLAKMVGRNGWDKILEEVAKCELVCANCHRVRTWNRKNANLG